MQNNRLWAPTSEITFTQYLQYTQLAHGIFSGVLQQSLSKHTMDIIANTDQLKRSFGYRFNELTRTLQWGFGNLDEALQNIGSQVADFHSDFNYYAGLIVRNLEAINGRLDEVITRLDKIYDAIRETKLTPARHCFQLAQESQKKGLLKEALEFYLESLKIYNSDFNTHFQLGCLYLYGINHHDNVINIYEAYNHLLSAVRYAKAEMTVDQNFSSFASQSLLHASISLYARIGEPGYALGTDIAKKTLNDAIDLANEASEIDERNNEALFHVAKYHALLGNIFLSIEFLRLTIRKDRNYSLKIEFDPAFDGIRDEINQMLEEEIVQQRNVSSELLKKAKEMINGLRLLKIDTSTKLYLEYEDILKKLQNAQLLYDSGTYFGILDAILIVQNILQELPRLRQRYINEVSATIISMIPNLLDNKKYPFSKRSKAKLLAIIDNSKKLIAHQDINSLNKAKRLVEFANYYYQFKLNKEEYLNKVTFIPTAIISNISVLILVLLVFLEHSNSKGLGWFIEKVLISIPIGFLAYVIGGLASLIVSRIIAYILFYIKNSAEERELNNILNQGGPQ